jgi:hypothetical protein
MRISVCIPQYNRCAHLLVALESIRAQTYGNVEVVVSDDGSTDESRTAIPEYLARSGMNYQYIQQEKNLGYDANLRAALAGATGEYLFILGNDDVIHAPTTLAEIATHLKESRPDLAIGNVADARTHEVAMRVTKTRSLAGSPEVALTMFRALSCVTGLIFSRDAFLRHNTSRYDGSIFVQMYLGSAIIASGGRLLTIASTIASTGTDVGAGHANSYIDTLPGHRGNIMPSTGGLDEVGRVVCEAIWKYVPPARRSSITISVFSQLLAFSYAYWLYDYRHNGAPWAAFNLALGCAPPRLLRKTDRSVRASAAIAPIYLGATSSMLVPLPILDRLKAAVRSYSIRNR